MAITSFYECQILINGVAVPEYDDEDNNAEGTTHQAAPTVTKYVQAISGAEFSIKTGLLPGWKLDQELAFSFFLDGDVCGNRLVRKANLFPRANSWVDDSTKEWRCNEWCQRKYKFADIVLGEGAGHLSPADLKARYSDLGKIRVEVWLYKLLSDKIVESRHSSPAADLGLSVVPEKALKGQALSLSASLGEPKPCSPKMVVDGLWIKTLAVFEFRYRSEEALQQLMIIPRPLPLEERPIEELTAEEARELLRRQKAQIDERARFKAEGKSNLKRERSSTTTNPRPIKFTRLADGKECIDLLSDSEEEKEDVKADRGTTSGTTSKDAGDEIELIDLL